MNDGVKTLVILSPGFPADEADSTCVPPQQVFVRNLKKNFPDLNIIVLAFEYPFVPSEYDWCGVSVTALGGRNRGSLYRLLNWRRVRQKLSSINKQVQVIGLLSFWLGDCAYIGSLFARKYKLPHFTWILGQDARPGNKYVKRVNPQGSNLIALSDFIAAEFYKNYGIRPARVVPAGIDAEMFSTISFERDIDILGAGSLIPLKQFHLIVSLVRSLQEFFPRIRAVICGNGPEREKLATMINDLELDNHIKLVGELPQEEVLALMQRTKVFVHPSAYEGFGIVCLEALYAGAQVVSFVRPMEAEIAHWHIAVNQSDMKNRVKSLLSLPDADDTPVGLYLVEDTNRTIMQLFNYSESAIF